jgi:hypothetical protein
MLHLLNEPQKNKVIKEYRMRLVIVICWLIIFISLTGVSLLIPSYLTAIGKVNSIKNENQQKENSIKSLNEQNFKDKIKKVDSSLSALKLSVNILSPREAYYKILNSLPAGVSVDRYTYNLVDSDNASISIDGSAVDRDRLVELQNQMKLNTEFIGINIPITNFAKKKDIAFSLKFNLIKVVKK